MLLIKPGLLLCILLPVALLSPLVAIVFGSTNIDISDVMLAIHRALSEQPPAGEITVTDRIIIELRMPRVLMAMICGAGLAVSGSVLQSVTRNPLADPYLFGISAGASLGAVLVLTGGLLVVPLPLAAFVGSLIAVAVVMSMARDGQVETLVLSGVAISFLLSSIANLVLYFGSPQAMQAVLFWSMGSFSRASWDTIMLPTSIVLISTVIIYQFQRPLQAMMAGDESAHTQGVAVLPLRLGMLLLTALMTSSLVASSGGIGFVGLMVPHIVRMLIGSASAYCLVATALLGAILMVWVDLLSRLILPSQELPVGVMTAMLGSLFFIGLLIKRKAKYQ